MIDPHFIEVSDILVIHRRVVEAFGGDPGLRDRGLLESAVAMPRATFGGEFLHPRLSDMAAACHFHLCRNHPFLDGNKRVAVAAAEVFLLLNGHELTAPDEELLRMTIDVAAGTASKDEVLRFFAEHTHVQADD
jgi:death-on-curing protein